MGPDLVPSRPQTALPPRSGIGRLQVSSTSNDFRELHSNKCKAGQVGTRRKPSRQKQSEASRSLLYQPRLKLLNLSWFLLIDKRMYATGLSKMWNLILLLYKQTPSLPKTWSISYVTDEVESSAPVIPLSFLWRASWQMLELMSSIPMESGKCMVCGSLHVNESLRTSRLFEILMTPFGRPENFRNWISKGKQLWDYDFGLSIKPDICIKPILGDQVRVFFWRRRACHIFTFNKTFKSPFRQPVERGKRNSLGTLCQWVGSAQNSVSSSMYISATQYKRNSSWRTDPLHFLMHEDASTLSLVYKIWEGTSFVAIWCLSSGYMTNSNLPPFDAHLISRHLQIGILNLWIAVQ